MHREYRVLEFCRGHILAQPLDGVRPESLKIPGPSKYVENEVIVVEPLPADSDSTSRHTGPRRCQVIARRLKRALELNAELDPHGELPPGEKRSAKVDELYALFGEDLIPEILEECRDAL